MGGGGSKEYHRPWPPNPAATTSIRKWSCSHPWDCQLFLFGSAQSCHSLRCCLLFQSQFWCDSGLAPHFRHFLKSSEERQNTQCRPLGWNFTMRHSGKWYWKRCRLWIVRAPPGAVHCHLTCCQACECTHRVRLADWLGFESRTGQSWHSSCLCPQGIFVGSTTANFGSVVGVDEPWEIGELLLWMASAAGSCGYWTELLNDFSCIPFRLRSSSTFGVARCSPCRSGCIQIRIPRKCCLSCSWKC